MMFGVAGLVLSSLLQVAFGGGPVYCQPGQVRQPLTVHGLYGRPAWSP